MMTSDLDMLLAFCVPCYIHGHWPRYLLVLLHVSLAFRGCRPDSISLWRTVFSEALGLYKVSKASKKCQQ